MTLLLPGALLLLFRLALLFALFCPVLLLGPRRM
jgi:hypothetical protein